MILDRIASGGTVVSAAYVAAGLPQPLLRDRRTIRVPPRAIGAGVEAASIGARTGVFLRRVDAPGLDLDITADYAVANLLTGAHDFLTHEFSAYHHRGRRGLAALRDSAGQLARADLLTAPERWRPLAFLAKVRPDGDSLTLHVELFGYEATVTAPVAAGSRPFWVTGYDLAAGAIEDLVHGGAGKVPEIVEAWTFDKGPRLRGLKAVAFPDGMIWDPRRAATYRSRDGRTWGHLPLMLAAMRESAKTDPSLTEAARARRRGMLKVASNAAAFGLYGATTRLESKPGTPHRVITSDGIIPAAGGTPERPGPWAFPPGAAMVEGAARLLLTLLLREIQIRGGCPVHADTDGVFVVATLEGGQVDLGDGPIVPALSFDQVQEIRGRFVRLARWTGLPISSDRLDGRRLITGEGEASLLKFAAPTVGPGGELADLRCYVPSLRRFLIHA